MRNPFRALMDRHQAVKVAEQLYQKIVEAARTNLGTGIDLPNDTEGGVAIIHHLLRLHPNVRVVRNAKNMTLVLDRALRQGTNKELYEHFTHAGIFFGPGGEDE